MVMKNSRGYRPKQRNSGKRKRKRVILLATEGKNKTETQYFSEFAKAQNEFVRFVPGNYTDPVQMAVALRAKSTEMELDPSLGDKAYCLVDADFDDAKDKQIAGADKIAFENNFKILVSSPCFEVWFLCHFLKSTKKYTSNAEILNHLKKHMPEYEKSKKDMYGRTITNVQDAISNAKFLEEACLKANYTPHTTVFSPSTEIYKLAEELLGTLDT